MKYTDTLIPIPIFTDSTTLLFTMSRYFEYLHGIPTPSSFMEEIFLNQKIKW